jgi:hypothetical protein
MWCQLTVETLVCGRHSSGMTRAECWSCFLLPWFQAQLADPGLSQHVSSLLDIRRRIVLNGLKLNSATARLLEVHDVADKANQALYASHLASPCARV